MAKSAFLHHTFRPDGDVAIERSFHLLWPFRCIPVEMTDSVGTGCCAIPATDASMENDSHQPFFIHIGGPHGTDLDTGGVFTVHAGPWNDPGFEVRILSFDVRKKLHPVDGTAL